MKTKNWQIVAFLVGAILIAYGYGITKLEIGSRNVFSGTVWTAGNSVSQTLELVPFLTATLQYQVSIVSGDVSFAGNPAKPPLVTFNCQLTVSGVTYPSVQFIYNATLGGSVSQTVNYTKQGTGDVAILVTYVQPDLATVLSASGTVNATITYMPYVVTVLPSTATVQVGQSQVFQASVNGGVSPYTFRWYVNSIDTGAVGSMYTVNTVNVGSISVQVLYVDAVVSVWSTSSILMITSAPSPPGSSTYVLNLAKTGSGTITPSEGVHSYAADSIVNLNAVANVGSSFNCWTIDGVNASGSSVNITMNMDHVAVAFFTEDTGLMPQDNQSFIETIPSSSGASPPVPSTGINVAAIGILLIVGVVVYSATSKKKGEA